MDRLKVLTAILGMAAAEVACGEDDDHSLVSFSFFQEQGFSSDLLVLEFSDGRSGRRLTGDDFGGAAGRRDVGKFETRTSGELLTSFWLVQGADTLSSGDLRLELLPDWEWNISFFRADQDPSLLCFGCVGSVAFELDAALQTMSADSVWLVWGGNSISDPVIF
jgi:hypothetical protein